MKMVLSKKVKIVALAALALIICAIAGFAFFKTKAPAEPPKKIVHTISYSWPYVDLDTAVGFFNGNFKRKMQVCIAYFSRGFSELKF